MLWTNDDANIVAYDSIGNLCTFDTKTGKLLAHVYMYSMASHADVAVTTDVERMFMTAKDGLLTELYNKKVLIGVVFSFARTGYGIVSKPSPGRRIKREYTLHSFGYSLYGGVRDTG